MSQPQHENDCSYWRGRHCDCGPKREPEPAADPVNHPKHYTSHPSGVECIDITEHYNFNLGNAIKYVWRAGIKSESPIEDLKKAAWYINREIRRLTKT